METTYRIDTNILVYAYNEDTPFHEKALQILENALNKSINAAIADKNLFESESLQEQLELSGFVPAC